MHREPERKRAVKLLTKIFGNLLSNPSNPKYGDLNLVKINKKFGNSSPAMDLLTFVGFARSEDGQRLKWNGADSNMKRLRSIHDALQTNEWQVTEVRESDASAVNQLMQSGFTKQEAEAALRMSGNNTPCATV